MTSKLIKIIFTTSIICILYLFLFGFCMAINEYYEGFRSGIDLIYVAKIGYSFSYLEFRGVGILILLVCSCAAAMLLSFFSRSKIILFFYSLGVGFVYCFFNTFISKLSYAMEFACCEYADHIVVGKAWISIACIILSFLIGISIAKKIYNRESV